MRKNLGTKLAIILAVVVIFVYGIFYGSGTPRIRPVKQLLAENINLGLDLRGGTHLILQVAVAEAVGATTDNDVTRLQQDLAQADVTGAEIRVQIKARVVLGGGRVGLVL